MVGILSTFLGQNILKLTFYLMKFFASLLQMYLVQNYSSLTFYVEIYFIQKGRVFLKVQLHLHA